jgi:DNA repair protein RadC
LPKLGRIVPDTSQLLAYLFELDNGRHDEFVHAFFLDRAGRLAWSETLATGLTSTAKVEFRHLICTALRVDATGLILAHNHPSGNATPSARDVTSTLDLQRICKKIGIELIDHLIVAAGRGFSFQAERLLRRGV